MRSVCINNRVQLFLLINVQTWKNDPDVIRNTRGQLNRGAAYENKVTKLELDCLYHGKLVAAPSLFYDSPRDSTL